ncbi:hypothetical protein MCQ_01003, partial [Candidatus Bartonella washoeensis Sb944nv]
MLFIFLRQESFLKLFLAVFVLFAMFHGISVSARSFAFLHSPTDNFDREHSEEQRLENLEHLRALTPKVMNSSPEREQGARLDGGGCFSIHHIVVEGAHHIKKHAVTAVTEPYIG